MLVVSAIGEVTSEDLLREATHRLSVITEPKVPVYSSLEDLGLFTDVIEVLKRCFK